MLNQDTKRKIDSARDILVGKVPDPKAQVEQITTALIYKFMDDMDKEAQELGGKTRFFTKGYEKYAWTKLMDAKLGGYERLDLYMEAISKLSLNPHIPQLFRDIFKDAFLPYRSPETLSLFLKEINGFTYEHSEDLGDAFEYLLSVLGSQGDAGQFRTPRHIIDFIVNVVDPKKDETVCDPACGTAGFLISAYKHILKQHDGKNDPENKEKPLTPDERKNLMDHFTGYDISPDMVKLSRVNLYLHGFPSPTIHEYDTLSSEEKWDESFDVMLANPPFMTPKGGIRPHRRFSVQANRSEVLFVDYILEHLRIKGRAGIIVPEGVIFKSEIAYKALRKMLVEDGLMAVVSLPSGVFNPYAGVKTCILIFDNEIAKKTKNIMFLKIQNDGFDLGAQRREHDENDLPLALEIIRRFKSTLKEGRNFTLKKNERQIANLVAKEEIAETNDYSLSGDRYKKIINFDKQKWPMVNLGEICEITSSKRVFESEWKKQGIPFYRAREIVKLAEYGFVKNELFISEEMYSNYSSKYGSPQEGDLMVTGVGTLGVCYQVKKDDTFYFKDGNIIWFRNFDSRVYPQYINCLFGSSLVKDQIKASSAGGTVGTYTITNAKKTIIPLPPLDVQKEIVEQIKSYHTIVSAAQQIINSYHPSLNYSNDWQKVKLNSVCSFEGGTQPPKSTFIDQPKKGYIRLLQIRDYKDDDKAVYIPTTERHKTCTKSDVMIGRYGPPVFQILKGKDGAYNVALIKCVPDRTKLNDEWLYYFLSSSPIQKRIISLSQRVRQSGVRPDDLNELEIPLPPLEIQKQLVAEAEKEQEIINSNKQLIEIYEKKISDVLSEI